MILLSGGWILIRNLDLSPKIEQNLNIVQNYTFIGLPGVFNLIVLSYSSISTEKLRFPAANCLLLILCVPGIVAFTQ